MEPPLEGRAEVIGVSEKDEACRGGRVLRTELPVVELLMAIFGFRVSVRYVLLLAAVLK